MARLFSLQHQKGGRVGGREGRREGGQAYLEQTIDCPIAHTEMARLFSLQHQKGGRVGGREGRREGKQAYLEQTDLAQVDSVGTHTKMVGLLPFEHQEDLPCPGDTGL